MKVNVYAEEIEPLTTIPTIIEKESQGVLYYGVQFGVSEHNAVTMWFTSKTRMYEVFNEAAQLAFRA